MNTKLRAHDVITDHIYVLKCTKMRTKRVVRIPCDHHIYTQRIYDTLMNTL